MPRVAGTIREQLCTICEWKYLRCSTHVEVVYTLVGGPTKLPEQTDGVSA